MTYRDCPGAISGAKMTKHGPAALSCRIRHDAYTGRNLRWTNEGGRFLHMRGGTRTLSLWRS
eukprot:3206652-Pleurochrysis_carterae.AAC.1